jgi:excisionase family DNA binding protein
MPKTDAPQPLQIATALPQLLSVDDVAAVLSVSSKTVRRMIDRGALSTCRVGRLVRVQRMDLERYIASCVGR